MRRSVPERRCRACARIAPIEPPQGSDPAKTRDAVEPVSGERPATRARELPAPAAANGAETLLAQAQRIEAIGRLAGGIAHDFNNLLGVISGYGELALESLPAGHPARASLDQILAAAARAAQLTRQMLAFSRQQVLRPRQLDLAALIADFEPMLGSLLGEAIELEIRGTPGTGSVLADPAQLREALVHLAENAREAMPRGAGRVSIEVDACELSAEYAASHPPAVPGPYVRLAFSDDGEGMSEEAQRRCFEPFYTTKAAGASGLGLSMVYGVVKQSEGFIWVYSEPGHGTTVKIYLPRIDPRGSTRLEADSSSPSRAAGRTVLVVEDMAAMRQMIAAVLAREGYAVLQAGDGEAALALAAGHSGAIDLLLTDVILPKMGGAELARRARAGRPGLRVLFISGYTEGAISQHGILEPGVELLEKPFAAADLLRAARRALAAAEPG